MDTGDVEELSNIWNAGSDTEWSKQEAHNPYHNYCKYFFNILSVDVEGERIFDCSLRSRLRPSKPHFVQITEMLLTSLR